MPPDLATKLMGEPQTILAALLQVGPFGFCVLLICAGLAFYQ